jgi:hypothetical protein
LIKLLIIFIIVFTVNAQFLEKNEVERLKRGNEFHLINQNDKMTLQYDIWRNSYLLDLDSITKRFKTEKMLFLYIGKELKINSIYIVAAEQESTDSDIFLFDLVDSVLRKFKRRRIVINEKL